MAIAALSSGLALLAVVEQWRRWRNVRSYEVSWVEWVVVVFQNVGFKKSLEYAFWKCFLFKF